MSMKLLSLNDESYIRKLFFVCKFTDTIQNFSLATIQEIELRTRISI